MASVDEMFPKPSIAIIDPDGDRVPPLGDESEVIAYDLVRAQQIHLARLQNKTIWSASTVPIPSNRCEARLASSLRARIRKSVFEILRR